MLHYLTPVLRYNRYPLLRTPLQIASAAQDSLERAATASGESHTQLFFFLPWVFTYMYLSAITASLLVVNPFTTEGIYALDQVQVLVEFESLICDEVLVKEMIL